MTRRFVWFAVMGWLIYEVSQGHIWALVMMLTFMMFVLDGVFFIFENRVKDFWARRR